MNKFKYKLPGIFIYPTQFSLSQMRRFMALGICLSLRGLCSAKDITITSFFVTTSTVLGICNKTPNKFRGISPLSLFAVTILLLNFFFNLNLLSAEVQKPLNIIATTNIIGDAVKEIAKDKVNLTSLMQPGIDPHLYRATFSDIKKLQSADIIFYNGLHLEGKMIEALESMSKSKKVFAVSKDIPKDLLNHLDNSENYDPHIWFNVKLWKIAVECIFNTLIQEDSKNGEFYKSNYEEYSKKLDLLNSYVTAEIQTIPEDRRILITAHDAFHYFGKEYKIQVDALQGVSTASEYGLRDITRIVELISQKGIKSIFIESTIPERFILSVKEGVIAKGKKVEIGGTLYSDSLGAIDSETGTYLGMVKYNVNTIVKALK